jgi:hypothetical protein
MLHLYTASCALQGSSALHVADDDDDDDDDDDKFRRKIIPLPDLACPMGNVWARIVSMHLEASRYITPEK